MSTSGYVIMDRQWSTEPSPSESSNGEHHGHPSPMYADPFQALAGVYALEALFEALVIFRQKCFYWHGTVMDQNDDTK